MTSWKVDSTRFYPGPERSVSTVTPHLDGRWEFGDRKTPRRGGYGSRWVGSISEGSWTLLSVGEGGVRSLLVRPTRVSDVEVYILEDPPRSPQW